MTKAGLDIKGLSLAEERPREYGVRDGLILGGTAIGLLASVTLLFAWIGAHHHVSIRATEWIFLQQDQQADLAPDPTPGT